MRKYLLAAASLALASCSATKPLPQYSEAEKEAQRQSIGYWQPAPEPADTGAHQHRPPVWSPADSVLWAHHRKAHPIATDSPLVAQQPAGKRRLFGLLPAKKVASSPRKVASDNLAGVPRKCKGCTFNVVAGNQTVAGKKAQVAAGDGATASVIEKKAGPAVVASDSSTQNAILGGGNLAAVHGDGNILPQTTTTQQAADWRATLAKPAGAVLAGVLSVVLVGGCIFLIAAYRRRKALTNNG